MLLQGKGKVYVVGNEGMSKELDNVGIENFGVGPDNEVTSINVPQIKKYAVYCFQAIIFCTLFPC